MKYLRTLDELLAMRTNGWACPPCGYALVDLAEGDDRLAMPAVPGFDPDCRHPLLARAQLTVEAMAKG